jgi:tryptophan halogenase
VTRLIHLFPFGGVSQSLVEQYNNDAVTELEKIRDFIVLHYYATERDDSPFWRFCAGMEIPESLAHRLRMFRERAHVWQKEGELFRLDSWMQVMIGQGIIPEHYHPLTKALKDPDLKRFLDTIRSSIRQAVDGMPTHQEFVDHYARASDSIWNMPAAK